MAMTCSVVATPPSLILRSGVFQYVRKTLAPSSAAAQTPHSGTWMTPDLSVMRASPASTSAGEPVQKPKDRALSPAEVATIAAVAAVLIQLSRRAYYAGGRPCACPEDLARNGSRCGGRSAWSRAGGAEPYCYVNDVPLAAINAYRARQ